MRARFIFEMAVNTDDKYYASPTLVNYVVNKALDTIGKENLTEIIEPSAGDGAFMEKLDSLNIPVEYYDKYPEHSRIQEKPFEELNLPYKKGRLFLGGPPYGTGSKLFLMFLRQAAKMGDYIAFISPPNFHEINPYPQFLELLHTEQLPYQKFLGSKERGEKDINMRSSFNIYKVDHNRKVEKDPLDRQLEKDFEIGTFDLRDLKPGYRKSPPREYEYYMTSWGRGLGEWSDKPLKSNSIGITVKNEKMRAELEDWLDNFHDRYFQLMKSRNTGAPRVQLDIFRKLLKNDLYK
jgi:hypothetical protein